MKKRMYYLIVFFCLISSQILAIPVGEFVFIDIPWALDASDDGSVVVGAAVAGISYYWTEETGVVVINDTGSSTAGAVSENGIIAGKDINDEALTGACWWDINSLEQNFLGSVEGSSPMGSDINSSNAISDDGSVIVGLHWYNLGLGSAKAYKWTEETGCILLPDVMDWYDSRADCITSDGLIIGGYAGDPQSSEWRPVLWTETELIQLPYVNPGWSIVAAISNDGEWCSGYNGNQGAIWHDQELVTLHGPNIPNFQTNFRSISDDGWAVGETANFNTQIMEPLIWNPEDSLMNALDFFQSQGIEIPEDYTIFRIRWVSPDHLIYVCNGYSNITYWNHSFIVKIPGPHPVTVLSAEIQNYNDINLTWEFDENTPGAQNVILLRDGSEIAQLDPSITEYLDVDLAENSYNYEIYVTYADYENSISKNIEIDVILNNPTELTAEVDIFNVELSWNVPLMQRSISGYNVYRNDQEISFVTDNMYSDLLPEPGDYVYYVTAMYSDQFESGQSNSLEISVDVSQYVPLNFSGEIDTDYDIHLTWDAPLDNDTLTGYNVYRNEDLIDVISETEYTDADLEDGIYTYYITTVFNEEFESDQTESLTFEIQQVGNSDDSLLPAEMKLSIYPNPFNPTTNIQYSLPADGVIKIDIYNIKGEIINTLLNEKRNSGIHTVTWNGIDISGKKVTSGMYFVRLLTEQETKTNRVILLK